MLNPTWIAGSTLTSDARSSLQAFSAMLGGHMPLAPRQRFGIADVRDVASAHLAAMSAPDAAGKRYCCSPTGPLQAGSASHTFCTSTSAPSPRKRRQRRRPATTCRRW
ncbi:hypothetical protein [Lacisediminihabitans profunda]|uniref:NAD-dependent epimerase/dehydratase family protein n=1 Tax=Lacisediminihabitans profunda TaxID=2594790 RepID=A0A5C8UKM1_9MICO|nr:hypothetical protein [Lacisediminihabitans profunda]TXN28367.1 hypothetical protein FVP33_18040 [Lacisediminihabitans profunda]